jgi:hypothetical protein
MRVCDGGAFFCRSHYFFFFFLSLDCSMAKKQTSKSHKDIEALLTADEAGELQLILDRLAVQNPEGESFSNWLESLKRSLNGRENLVAVLLQTLSRSPSEVGFRVFESLQRLVKDGLLKKVLKQAVYRFSQRGFGSQAGEETAERVVLVQAESRPSVAHMAVNSSSYLMLSALLSHPQASYCLGVSAYFETSLSHLKAKVTATSVKHYREFVQNVSGLFAFPFCEIPLWHAARLMKEMIELAASSHPEPDLREADQLLRAFYEPDRQPYVYELMESVDRPETELQALSIEPLFEYVPNSFLMLSKDELAPLAQRVREVDRSVLVVPREIQVERVYSITAKAIEELCVGKRRETLQRLMEEMALWLKLSRQGEIARAAWVIAQHIQKSASLGDNPFLQQLMFLSLREYWPEDFRTSEESAQATQPYRETDSGLIVLK